MQSGNRMAKSLPKVMWSKWPFRSARSPFSAAKAIKPGGFDLVRSYPRTVRHHIGTFPRDRNNNCYMCQAEKLVGFVGATPGRNLEFDPTLSALSTTLSPDLSPVQTDAYKIEKIFLLFPY